MRKSKNLIYWLLFAGLGLASLGGINNLNSNKGDNKSRFNKVKRIKHNNGTLVELFYSNVHADSDLTPPITEVNHQPPNPNDTSDVYIIATAKDEESGIQEFKVYLDNLGNKNPDSIFFDPEYPESIAVSIPLSDVWPNGPEGAHSYYSTSTNSFGIVGNDPPSPLNKNIITNDELSLSVPTKNFTVNSSIMTVPAGWAMISLPRQAAVSTVSGLFSGATTTAYHFNTQSGGYEAGDTLYPGEGVWIKFASEETLPVVGDSVSHNSILVDQGWNQIATKNNEKLIIPIANISSVPSSILASSFYYYDPENRTYTITNTLKRSGSYWIKSTQPGVLIINDAPPSSNAISLENRLDELPPAPPGELSSSKQKNINLSVYLLDGINFSYTPTQNSSVEIYDALGRKVKSLKNDLGLVNWNLMNENGYKVSNGMYMYRVLDNGRMIGSGRINKTDNVISLGK